MKRCNRSTNWRGVGAVEESEFISILVNFQQGNDYTMACKPVKGGGSNHDFVIEDGHINSRIATTVPWLTCDRGESVASRLNAPQVKPISLSTSANMDWL